jgi:hypothetical protein
MYKIVGDVQVNSPSDWTRISTDALTAISNPGNDRYYNYDKTQGLDSPITELNSPWVPDNSWPARVPYIDAKEPRPRATSRSDHGAISVMNAGFVYLLLGDDGWLGRYTGSRYAEAVRDELLYYADDEWLDFSNNKRWLRNNSGFADRNPGFFIATWLNTLISAYDYTRNSSVYTDDDVEKIETWLFEALSFFYDLKIANTEVIITLYSRDLYTSLNNGGWFGQSRGQAWDNSPFVSYGFNETFANRSTAQWRFIMRAALLFREHESYGEEARDMVRTARRWFRDWIVFGTFKDGTYSDFHRGSASAPQKGLEYTSIALGCAIDAIDAYERLWANEVDFESLYEWEMTHGDDEYQHLIQSQAVSAPWFGSFIPGAGESKSFKMVLKAYAQHFDGTYGNTRRWGANNIDGHSGGRELNDDRWIAPAVTYYSKSDPELATYLKSVYTRTAPGTRPYVDPSSSNQFNGSYSIHEGSWAGHSGTLFMFGKMDEKVYPYGNIGPRDDPFRYDEVADDVWRNSSWFGWNYVGSYPWVWNLNHGWLYYSDVSTDEAITVFDLELSWVRTAEDPLNYYYSFSREDWLFYSENSTAPRYFYSFNEEQWLQFPEAL